MPDITFPQKKTPEFNVVSCFSKTKTQDLNVVLHLCKVSAKMTENISPFFAHIENTA